MVETFDNDFLPAWCDLCNSQGYYFVESPETPYWIVHPTCGWEAISTWCHDCEMGFILPTNSGIQSLSWECPNCKEAKPLPKNVFEHSVTLYLESELPPDIRPRVIRNKPSFSLLAQILGILGAFALFLATILRRSIIYSSYEKWALGVGVLLIVIGVFVGKAYLQKHHSHAAQHRVHTVPAPRVGANGPTPPALRSVGAGTPYGGAHRPGVLREADAYR